MIFKSSAPTQKIGNSQEKLVNSQFWQGHKDLNPEPTVLETAALPIELYPYLFKKARPFVRWWALRDSNPGLSGYEPEALTNSAKGP